MATEDLVPAYLAEIYNRAIPDPLTDNEPLQAFSAPLDTITLTEAVTVAASAPTSLYGQLRYGRDHYS